MLTTELDIESCADKKRIESAITTSEELGPLTTSSYNAETSQEELAALWTQQRQKDAQNLVLEKKLSHYRSWMNTLQNKVSQQNPQIFKNAKRLYIGGFQPGTNEEELRLFLYRLMKQTGGCSMPGNPILSIRIMKDRNFAFAEFRSIEETVNATALDGIAYEDKEVVSSHRLKIRRPSNYDINSACFLGPLTPDPTMNLSGLDICRSTVDDSPHKLFIGGLPYDYNEDRVKEMVSCFAEVKSFNLVMDRTTGKSKGYAFCELIDESKTDWVIHQLNSQKIENKLLTVKRAIEGGKNTNSVLLQSLIKPVVPGGQTGTMNSLPLELSTTSLRGTVSPDQGFGGAPPQRPYTALGLTTGSYENLFGGTPASDGSMQANNMLTQLAAVQNQRPSSVISQLCNLANGATDTTLNSGSFVGGLTPAFHLETDLINSSLAAVRGGCFPNEKSLCGDSLDGLHCLENPGGGSLW